MKLNLLWIVKAVAFLWTALTEKILLVNSLVLDWNLWSLLVGQLAKLKSTLALIWAWWTIFIYFILGYCLSFIFKNLVFYLNFVGPRVAAENRSLEILARERLLFGVDWALWSVMLEYRSTLSYWSIKIHLLWSHKNLICWVQVLELLLLTAQLVDILVCCQLNRIYLCRRC